jgi:hypothetical protein
MSTRTTGTDPGSKSVAEIEREVQQSRAEIENTLDAIQERLSPGQLVDQALNYFRGGRGVDFARNLGDSVASNPIPVTLMGVGLAWMMISGQRSGRGDRVEYEDWDDDPDPIEEGYVGLADERVAYLHTGADLDAGAGFGDAGGGFGDDLREAGRTAKDKLGELGDQARDAGARVRERVGRAGRGVAGRAHDARSRVGRYGRRAKRGMLRSLEEQPLLLGAIGLAIGAALGAALPPTETEDELMGETRDKALRQATRVGREQAEKVRDAAGAVATAAREEAGRQGLTPKSSGEAGGGTFGRSAETVGEPDADASRPAGPAGDPRASLDRP